MTATPESPSSPPPCPPYPYFYPPEDDGVELTWILRAWWTRRIPVIKIAALVTLLGVLYALYLPNEFTSTAALVIPPSKDGGSSLKKMVAAASGMQGLLGFGGSAETYIAILKSRRVSDAMVARFDLQKRYDSPTLDDAVKELANRSAFENVTDTDVLKISYTTPVADGRLPFSFFLATPDARSQAATHAASVTRAFVDELNTIILSLGVTGAERERDFLEKRVNEARLSMEKAEGALAAYKSQGAVAPPAQASATLQALAQLQGRLIGLRASQEALRATLSDRHPEILTLANQIGALEAQITQMSRRVRSDDADGGAASPSSSNLGGTFLPLYMLPTLEREYAALIREAVIQATIYTALLEQYEQARIMAARDVAPLKLLDAPTVPQLKSKPRRSVICILSGFLGLMLALGWALACEARASGALASVFADEPAQS